MREMYNFDYFYGNEAEQYQFYMIPQILFTDKKFKKISTDAKVLYSLLLDRTGLSFANKERFTDNDGKTYIYFTRDTVIEMLGCSKDKSAAIFKELDEIGLIERKRQGLGKPDKIYVKHFNRILDKSEEFQEGGNNDFQRSEKPTSASRKNRLQEGGKTDTNQTNINHTNFIKTDLNQSVNQSAKSEPISTDSTKSDGQIDRQISEQKKSMTFSEVLNEIGYTDNTPLVYEYESERDFECFNEAERETDKCQIPYSMKNDKKAMAEAIKFLFAYSYYAPNMKASEKRLFDLVISILTEMSIKDIQKYQGQTVRYCDVIDRLNDILRSSDYSLPSWYFDFECQWNKILAENDIKYQKAYMKSCIWNWLNDFAFEEDNFLRELEYEFKHKSDSAFE